jgi:hypothetical protein
MLILLEARISMLDLYKKLGYPIWSVRIVEYWKNGI